MAKDEKPLTLNQLTKYNKNVLFPFMKENFVTKKEFEGLIDIVATKEELRGVEGKLDGVANDVKEIKSLLIDFGTRTKTLEGEVDFIKNSLSIQPIKK